METEIIFKEILPENFPNLVKNIIYQTNNLMNPKQYKLKENHTSNYHT